LVQESQVTIAVQVDGKLRGQLMVDRSQIEDKAALLAEAKKVTGVEKWLKDKQIGKEIYVPGKIVSFVTRP